MAARSSPTAGARAASGWPSRSSRSSGAGAEGCSLRLGRDQRLRKRSEFLRAQRQSTRAVRGPVIVLVHRRAEPGPARLGVVASRKVGGAVQRNRGKRRVREWFRAATWLAADIDVVVILRPGATEVPYHELCASLDAAVRQAMRAALERGRRRPS